MTPVRPWGASGKFAGVCGARVRGLEDSVTIWPALALLPLLVVGRFKAVGLDTLGGVDTTFLAVLFLCCVAAWFAARGRGVSLRGTAPLWLLFMIFAVAQVESELTMYSKEKSFQVFLLVVPSVLALLILCRSLDDLRGILVTWLAAGTIIATATLLLNDGTYRFTLGGNYLDTSYLVGSAIAILIFGVSDRWIPLKIGVALILANVAVLVALGARGPLLALGGVLIWRVLTAASVRVVFIILFVLAPAALVGWLLAGSVVQNRYSLIFTAGVRADLIDAAFELWRMQPFAGWGWGSFSSLGGSNYQYPHNILAEAAAELGIVGFAALVFLIVSVIFRLWKYRANATCRAAGGLAFFWLIFAQFSGDLSTRLFWLALVPSLILPGLCERNSTKKLVEESVDSPGVGLVGKPRRNR